MKNNKIDITKIILKCLIAGGAVVAILALPGMAPVLKMFTKKDSKYKLRNTIYNLKRTKMVKMYYKDGKEMIEITEKGKKRLLKYEFDEMKIKKPKKWDGLWRVVIFDIPEPKKYARNALSRKLKEVGFYPLQKSTFIFPYKCFEEVQFIRKYFDVEKYVSFLVAKEMEGSSILKKHFKIK